MGELLLADQWLFHKINYDWSFYYGDIFFSGITDLHKTSYFIYGILPLFLIFTAWIFRKRTIEVLAGLGLAVSLTDFIAGTILKPFVGRLRPILVESDSIQRAEILGRMSFPSNHASNAFCAAVVLSYYYPKMRWVFFVWALLIAYSRPYVGAHYPGDVLVGALLGTLIGLIAVAAVRRVSSMKMQGSSQ